MDPERKEAWERLKVIGEAERHFNEIESKYRGLASTWLLASFPGMGFVIESTSFPLRKELVVLWIAIAGSVGIQLIWYVDLLAYHRLLQSFFVEGLVIELQNPDFPQARWNMLALTDSVEGKVKIFYLGCTLSLLILGVVALYLLLASSTLDRITLFLSGIGFLVSTSTMVGLLYLSDPPPMKEIFEQQEVVKKERRQDVATYAEKSSE